MSSRPDDYEDYYDDQENDDDSGKRHVWEIFSWIFVALTLILNLVIILILVIRRNAFSVVNKGILTVAIVDLLYGMLVSPFYVENYVYHHWDQSGGYCKFFTYFFTFHDLFVPFVLILLSIYISLKYSGASEAFEIKKPIYVACFLLVLIGSILLAIPATHHSTVFIENPPGGNDEDYKKECRTLDNYTMVLTYCVSSFSLFCFTMSFLFSLCIVGSPMLKNVYDREEYVQRWRFMLSLSLVNGLYMATGFLINFKEISRMFQTCCEFNEPFDSLDTVTYDVWSFIFLIGEPFWRPLVFLGFYWKYLLTDVSEY